MTVASRPSSPAFPRAQLYDELAVTAPPVPTLTNASSGDTDNVADNERLGVCGADGKPINPNKWSKADVLEGALNVIADLRKQLVEERLARTLGVPVPQEYPVDAGDSEEGIFDEEGADMDGDMDGVHASVHAALHDDDDEL